MWRQDDLFAKINGGNLLRVPEDGGLDGVRKTIVGPGPVHLPGLSPHARHRRVHRPSAP